MTLKLLNPPAIRETQRQLLSQRLPEQPVDLARPVLTSIPPSLRAVEAREPAPASLLTPNSLLICPQVAWKCSLLPKLLARLLSTKSAMRSSGLGTTLLFLGHRPLLMFSLAVPPLPRPGPYQDR